MCLLNSRLLDFLFKLISVPFRGSFYSANKQFIAPLPIRLPDAGTGEALTTIGKRLQGAARALEIERSGFRDWLSDLVGAPVSTLSGRTRLQRPDSLDAAELLAILIKNRKSLAVDPGSRGVRDRLVIEHRASVGRLGELRREIEGGEAEADEIVFDLYGVTAQHRALVDAATVPGSS